MNIGTKTTLFIGSLFFFVFSVGYYLYTQTTQASEIIQDETTSPVVTTGQFAGMTAEDLRLSLAALEVEIDLHKSGLYASEKLRDEKKKALERVRCQDSGLSITEYCQKINGLGK